MTVQINQYVGGKGVSLRQRTVVRKLTLTAVTAETAAHTTISIPNCNIKSAQVYLAPGANYSVFVQLGYGGTRMIPSDNANDYIIGPGIAHTFQWGIDAYGPVDVWTLRNNAFDHTIYVRLDLDLQAVIDYAQPRAVRRVI